MRLTIKTEIHIKMNLFFHYQFVFTNFFSLHWSLCIQSDILHLHPSMYLHTTTVVILLNLKSDQIMGSLLSIVMVTQRNVKSSRLLGKGMA